jgi:hypothetical protein
MIRALELRSLRGQGPLARLPLTARQQPSREAINRADARRRLDAVTPNITAGMVSMGPADGSIPLELFVAPAALHELQRYAGSPPLSERQKIKKERSCGGVGLKTSRLNRFEYSTFDFAIKFRLERWMPKAMAPPNWTKGQRFRSYGFKITGDWS